MANKKNRLGILAIMLILGMMVVGCVSAPPPAFETAGSLEGTAWTQGSILVMKDKTSGVLTDRDDKETAFTYTAVFDAENISFAGTITLEDGRVVEFSAKKAAVFGWALTAKELEESSFYYATPERLEAIYNQKKIKAEIVEKYGSEYLELEHTGKLKRESDGFMMEYGLGGLVETTEAAITIVLIPKPTYKLHSKDGVTMTLLKIDNPLSVEYSSTEGAGTFNLNISGGITTTVSGEPFHRRSGATVTISNGTGAGEQFNGVYKIQ